SIDDERRRLRGAETAASSRDTRHTFSCSAGAVVSSFGGGGCLRWTHRIRPCSLQPRYIGRIDLRERGIGHSAGIMPVGGPFICRRAARLDMHTEQHHAAQHGTPACAAPTRAGGIPLYHFLLNPTVTTRPIGFALNGS